MGLYQSFYLYLIGKTSAQPNHKARHLPGGNTGLRLPAPRQAHSPSEYTGTHDYGSNFSVMSPRHICARPGRRCPHFVLNWRCQRSLEYYCNIRTPFTLTFCNQNSSLKAERYFRMHQYRLVNIQRRNVP